MGVPKPTEMTIRNFLLKELEKRGVKVNTEISYTTPIGRLMPDMLLYNGAQYVVETKLGAETKLLDAMVRLYDYSKYTQTKGAFAVLFPKELRQPWNIEILEKIARDPKLEYAATAIFKDLRPSQRFAGNLSQMADWMAGQVLRPLVVEADTSFAIKVLTEAVQSITVSVRMLRKEELEDIFGGKTVFENILQYEEGRYPLDEMRQAATYLLVNQIIFYHVLSRMDATFIAIDEGKIGKPADLQRYFEPVLKRDYTPVFGFDVASRLPESANETVKRVIMAVKALAPEKIAHDVLGKVFHGLIPFNIRKAVAAFYTNNEAAEILAQLAIDKPDAKVIDLAVGSGTLLVAAYRRKKELLQKSKGAFELPEDHKRFLEQDLTGVDIMPFAAHLAVMHLSLQALLSETEKVRVAVWDSTELKPGLKIPAIFNELKAAYRRPTLDMFKEGVTPKEAYIRKGAITLEGLGGEEIPLDRTDLVIMNPPFTRHERMPESYKNRLYKRFSAYQNYLHGQLGYYGYFVLLADKFIKKDGRIALVLPATLLRLASTEGVRRLILENYQLEHIISTWQRAAFSEGAKFREILLIARKPRTRKQAFKPTTLTILKKLPQSLGDAKNIANMVRELSADPKRNFYENDILTLRKIPQHKLLKHIDNLFPLISYQNIGLLDLWEEIVKKSDEKLTTLTDHVISSQGDIKRGLELWKGSPAQYLFLCYDESRALKKKDKWVLKGLKGKKLLAKHRFLDKEIVLPQTVVLPSLRRAATLKKIDVTNEPDFILIKRFQGFKDFLELSNCKLRVDMNNFKKYVHARLTHFALVARFNISAPGTRLLGFYSSVPIAPSQIMWAINVSKETAKLFALWFNSSFHILQLLQERKETEGAFIQILGYSLKKLLVMDENALSKDEKAVLLQTFEEIKREPFPSILKQLKTRFPARVSIDKSILRVLGFDNDEIDRILDFLYPALAKELEQLKTLMAGK